MAEEREWKNGKPGKSQGQKLKSLLVMQYILKNADDEHAVTIGQIEAILPSTASRQSGAPSIGTFML